MIMDEENESVVPFQTGNMLVGEILTIHMGEECTYQNPVHWKLVGCTRKPWYCGRDFGSCPAFRVQNGPTRVPRADG